MRARRLRTAGVAIALGVLAVAGCSDDEPDALGPDDDPDQVDPDAGEAPDAPDSPDAPDDEVEVAVELTFAPDAEATDDELDQAVDVVEQRLAALGVEATVAAEAGGVVVGLADDDRAVAERVADAVEARGELRFRPVLAALPAGVTPTGDIATSADDDPAAEVTLASTDGTTYTVGPTQATGAIVESAEATTGPTGDWEVDLRLREGEDGIDRFNAMAAACVTADATCPIMQLAIVVDSVVRSAPTIQQPAYEPDQIVISGAFQRDEAQELAAVLVAGALPFDLVLQD